jgi:ABC-2 type transport system permease protein
VNAWRAFDGAFTMHLRLYTFRRSRFITAIVAPATTGAIGVLVLRTTNDSAAAFCRVLVGGGLAGMWGSLLGTAVFTLRREREWYGTLPLLSVVPAPVEAIFGAYLLAEAAIGFAGIVASLLVGWGILGGRIAIISPDVFALSTVLSAVSLGALALVFMPVVVLLPILTRWINMLEYPVWLLAGFLFPVALLPGWMNHLSPLVSAYWATAAMSGAAQGTGWAGILPDWAALAGLSVGYVALSIVLLRLVVTRVRQSGALTLG